MATTPHQSIAAQYENYAVYVLLSSRGAQPGFHWGIFIPTASPNGHVWHATNREGGWKLEQKISANVPFSMSLVLAYKIGSVNPSSWQTCLNVLNGVNANGIPSPNTGEQFSCRVWVKDAILALHNNHILVLSETISAIEVKLVNRANAHKTKVEGGQSPARVENSGN
ncbi:hypothetical protein PHISCL_05724 [Aspergillus sclerotialis]|uniref:Uncharacterized protein n=1 Tax=Aspergillus sclerotialis TaxID=2070753 RepID=A0A3A2ZFJ7_9EURO|nr:hypothetical protein PHISCL_05724 [Aspergillus sclerotialis]